MFQKKTVGSGDNKRKVKIDHKNSHILFSKTVDAIYETVAAEATVLENGENEYPFSITLPQELPSSYHTLLQFLDFTQHGKKITFDRQLLYKQIYLHFEL